MKRLTSILLVLSMLLTLAPINIFAAEAENTVFSDMNETDYYAQAATALEQLDILTGYPDGTFGAEKSITRAEMAAVVCRMINKEADAEKAKGETIFDDVSSDHWASGYINIASEEGIINGDGNGKFRPEDDVKHEEAIKMVVCALGYGDDVEVDEKDWSKGYLEVADEKGISADLKGTKGEASTRGDVAVMSYNGLATDDENAKIPATPVASKEAGEYKGTQKVKLTTTTKDADIYYTTDGTTPTAKSTKYKKEISISKTSTLKAIAVKNGVASKGVLSVEYTIEKEEYIIVKGGSSSSSSRPTTYTLSFATSENGSVDTSIAGSYAKNSTINLTATPDENYVFVKWESNNGGAFADANSSTTTFTMPAKSVVITAVFAPAVTTYTVSFDLNYEGATGAPARQIVNKDDWAVAPTTPEREGFAFVGWYVDSTYAELFNFATPITKTYTLVARWVDMTDTTDTDSDGLTDPVELYYGTDKTKADTDEDGLTDFFEINSSNTNPLVIDSDENGTNDADEDFDEDSLTNLQEQTNNCNPYSDDTDMDGLTDADEINVHNTEPAIEDTDEDGLADGDEIELGLNPLVQKTDGETLDSERTFAQTLSTDNISDTLLSADNAAIPSLNMNVAGNVDSNTTITTADDEALTTNKSVVGAPISISTTADMSSGESTISFDISGGVSPFALMSVEDEEETSQYLICKYSENEENTEFEPLDTSYNNGILSASIDSEGTYFVLDTESFLTNLGIYPLDYFESPAPMMLMSMAEENEEKVIIPHEPKHVRKRNANKKQELSAAPMMLSSVEELEEELTLMSASTIGTRAQADIVFVIDVTGSMGGAIDNVATNVNKFADDLVNKYKINANFSVIEFQDITCDGLDSTIQHKNGSSSWWNARSVNSFKNEINNLYLGYGGDWAETPIDGLAMARNLVSSSSTQKFFVLVTDAPYKENNQYGIENMEEMIGLLVADDVNVSVITDDWSDWSEPEYDVVGYYYIEDEYDMWSVDVYYDSEANKYFYLEYDYDYESGKETSSKIYIDKSKVTFEVYVGYIEIDDDWYDVYHNSETNQYYYIKWTYDYETGEESYEKINITDISSIVFGSDEDGKVSGYKDLYEKTGGVFGNIYDSSFSTTLDAIAGMIDVDVNDGSWIVLDNYETIKLEKAPTSDSTSDTDKDGVLDINELTVSRNTNLKEYISAFLSARGLTYERYIELGGTPYVTVWSFKSRPDDVDTDDDGFSDKEDSKPKKWDVSYRDLVILSKAVYSDLDIGTVLTDKKIQLKTASGIVASTAEMKGWRVIHSVYNPLTGFEAAAYAKDKNLVLAMRGSESKDLADILQDWGAADILGFISGLNWQLPAMETFVKDTVKDYGHYYDNIYVTGHSLGGYLALMASSQLVWKGVKDKIEGVVTFNGLGLSPMSGFLDWDDYINLWSIGSKVKNYKVEGDVVSMLGNTPGDDISRPMSTSLGSWSIGNAHSLVSFAERFSNEMRKPEYSCTKKGLNDEK